MSLITSSHAADYDFSQHYRPEALDVPNVGGISVGIIDQQNEKILGEKVYREIHAHLNVIQDPWLEDQLDRIFRNIVSQTNLGAPIGLLVINDKQVNAFAVPGGVFAINTGLIELAKNRDEVASVMGHEVAHVTQRHYSRSQEAFKGQTLLALAGILIGAAIATKSDSGAGSAVMLGTQAALVSKQLSYSRDQEREADRIGMQYLVAAGYNPNAMADFFERMQRSSVQLSFMPEYWMTHPLTTARMSEARLRARQYPSVKPNISDPDYELVKWYAAVLSNDVTEQQLKTLQAQHNQAAILALTAFYVQQGDALQAQAALNTAQGQTRQKMLAVLLQTDIFLLKHQFEQAYQTILAQQQIMPENRALTYKLAEVLIRKNQPAPVFNLVNKILRDNPRDVQGWDLMQRAAAIDHASPVQGIQVLRYRAEVEFWSGREEDGIKSLLHAQRLAKNNMSLSATIDQRLKEMQADRLFTLE
ncbi:M48 family metalloprotease [Acinetobacter sp. MB5]|uniref:M48 family metalloprotease n=1 Tax=Acinetobacter sp. MB5 TaxID=2069438 RepID=UPI00196A8FD2|nr:M48 family metalloprotease [Acinetobacter sp. MB5]